MGGGEWEGILHGLLVVLLFCCWEKPGQRIFWSETLLSRLLLGRALRCSGGAVGNSWDLPIPFLDRTSSWTCGVCVLTAHVLGHAFQLACPVASRESAREHGGAFSSCGYWHSGNSICVY